jgi:POT family proton-dependent oligopeptide transporter
MEPVIAIPIIKSESEKHPKELYSVAFSSMWDMFSFYGMKALLIAYIVTQLKLGQPMGYAILGTYAALVFGFSFAGGIVADNFLGTRKSVIWGNYLQIAGHLVLALPFQQPFFAGLALIATGSGFRGSSSGSLIGSFYPNRSARKKDDAYALYYMLFNLGAALGGLICGYLGQNINWHIGFGAACFFMIIGQTQFITGVKKIHGLPPDIQKLKEKIFLKLLDREAVIYLLSLLVVALVVITLEHPGIMNVIMLPVTILSFVYVFIISFRFTKQEQWKLFAALIMLLMTSLFWAAYEQCAGSLSLFVLHNVDLNIAGIKLSGLSVNSFTPAAWLVVLTPLSIKIWATLHQRNANPATYTKFILAFLFLAICFFILWLGCYFNKASGMMPVLLLITAYVFLEMGEICLGPVAYSLASKLSPAIIASTVMGVMYLSVSLGEYLSGKLGAFMSVPSNIINPVEIMPYFSSVFIKIAIGCVVIALLIILLIPLFKKWMQDVQ